MSFIQHAALNTLYQPGWFLAVADCVRKTVTVPQNHSQVVTKADGSKYVPEGALISGVGLLYEDVDVTTGAMPGSAVTEGTVYEDRLPASYDSTAKAGIPGIKFITAAPDIDRPDFSAGSLAEITVESAAGTASGDTAITVSEYTPGSGESYVYKVDTKAPVIGYGAAPDYTWTGWDGTSDITATTGKKIAIVSVKNGKAVAYGTATVTAKP